MKRRAVSIRVAKGYGNPVGVMVRGKDLIDLGDGTALLRVSLKCKGTFFGPRQAFPDSQLRGAPIPAVTPHPFRGRIDRGCIVCNQPDRHPVHAANPEEG